MLGGDEIAERRERYCIESNVGHHGRCLHGREEGGAEETGETQSATSSVSVACLGLLAPQTSVVESHTPTYMYMYTEKQTHSHMYITQ